MKKTMKIISILMIVLMILMTCSPVFANDKKGDESKSGAGQKATIGGVEVEIKTSEASGKVGDLGNNILGIIQVVGTIIAVGVLMVIGIKYMMGSAEEKAEYKKTMLPYVIGAIILFAAVNIAKVVVDMSQTITADATEITTTTKLV